MTYLSIIDHYEDFNKGHRHDAPHLLHQLHHLRSFPDRRLSIPNGGGDEQKNTKRGLRKSKAKQSQVLRAEYVEPHFEFRRLARHAWCGGAPDPLRYRPGTDLCHGQALTALMYHQTVREICWCSPAAQARPLLAPQSSWSAASGGDQLHWPAENVDHANKQFSLIRAAMWSQADSLCRSRLRAGARIPDLPRQAQRVRVRVEDGHHRVRRPRQEAVDRAAEPDPAVRHDRVRVQGAHRAHHHQHGTGSDQRDHQGGLRPAAEGLLHAGTRREGHRLSG